MIKNCNRTAEWSCYCFLGYSRTFWVVMTFSDHFGLWLVLGHYGLFWIILGHFGLFHSLAKLILFSLGRGIL